MNCNIFFLFISFISFIFSLSSYNQIITNKYLLNSFNYFNFSSSIIDKNGYCYVAINSLNDFLSSRKNIQINNKINKLNNLYSNWYKIINLNSLFNLTNERNQWKGEENEGNELKLIKAPDTIIIVSSFKIIEISMDFFCSKLVSIEERVVYDNNNNNNQQGWGNVYSLTISDNYLWMGTSTGLYIIEMTYSNTSSYWKMHLVQEFPTYPYATSLLWVDSWSTLFIGTDTIFYDIFIPPDIIKSKQKSFQDVVSSWTVYHEWIGGNIDNSVVSMHYDNIIDCIWVAEKNSVHQRNSNQMWWRYRYKQGAIADNIISIASMYLPSESNSNDVTGYLWIATTNYGLTRMKIKSKNIVENNYDIWDDWQLYYGPRFLPDEKILFIVSDSQPTQSSPSFLRDNNNGNNNKESQRDLSSTLLVFTELGFTYIHVEPWTLSEKAETFQRYFHYPRHDRNGIVAEVSLATYGNLSSYYHTPADSDGIWTAQYAVASAFRYSFR